MYGYNSPTGRFDLPSQSSDLKSRDKLNQLPGRIGTMRQWLVEQVKQLRGLDFTEKKPKPEPKPEEPKKEEKPKEDKPKEEKAEKKDK